MPSRVVAVINPGAGKGDATELVDSLTQRFKSAGLATEVIFSQNGAEIVQAARSAVQQKPLAIIAGGGDGTINAVASALVDTRIPLGVLPLGTLNHFAKDLHIPLELEEATRNIMAGHLVNIDVGEVNDRIILNNSSLGLYPSIVRLRDQQQERLGRGKWPAFVWAALTVLHRYPFLNVRLSIDGNELTRRTPFVFIGNNEYEMESFNIGSRGCLNAGQLSLYMPHATGRWGLLRLGFRALAGRLAKRKTSMRCAPKKSGSRPIASVCTSPLTGKS